MAERQRFGCSDTWPCNCKQIPSLRFPILYIGQGLFKEIGMNHNAQVQIFKKFGEIWRFSRSFKKDASGRLQIALNQNIQSIHMHGNGMINKGILDALKTWKTI